MKKAISILLSLLFVINLFSLNSFAANNNISSENFFLQIKELAYKYDDSSVLADEGIERVITNRLIVKTSQDLWLSRRS